jgi:phage shock protein E
MKTIILITAVIAIALIIMFLKSSKQSAGTLLNPETFKQKIDDTPGVVIDVRTKSEYDSGRLKITKFNYDMMNGQFQAKLDSLDKNDTYYLYCRSGNRSGKAVQMMKNNGFENVFNIGGFSSLANSGLETE